VIGMGIGKLGRAMGVAVLLVGCGLTGGPFFDAEPIPFPNDIYETYSAGIETGYGLVDDAAVPRPRISTDLAIAEAVRGMEENDWAPTGDVIGLMRRQLTGDDGEPAETVWLVAFASGPVAGVDDQTGELILITCCFEEEQPRPS